MRTRCLAAALFIAALCYSTAAVSAPVAFKKEIYKSSDGKTIPYRMHLPEKMSTKKKYPLVLLLHGSGERGDDNEKQLIHGARDILKYMKENKIQAIIIVPQCPEGEQWVNVNWTLDSNTMPKKPSASMKIVIELLKRTVTKMPVDKKRIYVTGLSMGGFGAWDIVQRMPKVFAAAIPICGGGDTKQVKQLKKLPIWAFHGAKDTAVKPKRSRDMIAAIKAIGGKPNYTEYPTAGHVGSWNRAYKDPEVLEWLFSQKKETGRS